MLSVDLPYRYLVYGLRLCCRRPLLGLAPAEGDACDLNLHLQAPWPENVPPMSSEGWSLASPADQILAGSVIVHHLPAQAGRFTHIQFILPSGPIGLLIDPPAGNAWVFWSGGVTFDDVAAVLLGPGLGCVLRLRGVPCLHASVVARDGRAMALVGPSGRGKTTTAAALTRHNFSVLSDDIGVLAESAGGFWVQPGVARLRVTPGTALAMDQLPQSLSAVHSFDDKRYLELDPAAGSDRWRFGAQALPLSAIYVLGKRNPARQSPLIWPYAPRESLTILAKHSYARYVADRDLRAGEFACFTRLAQQVPIRHIAHPNALSALPQLAALLASDFDAQAPR